MCGVKFCSTVGVAPEKKSSSAVCKTRAIPQPAATIERFPELHNQPDFAVPSAAAPHTRPDGTIAAVFRPALFAYDTDV
jgi:hypothetical protein